MPWRTSNPTDWVVSLRWLGAAALLSLLAASDACSQSTPAPQREVRDGITTKRFVPGAPYELAGKRLVFTSWYYIQPGDLDWRTAEGKSVYVVGRRGSIRCAATSASTRRTASASRPRGRRSWGRSSVRIA